VATFALQLPVFGCNMLHANEECVIKPSDITDGRVKQRI